MPEKTKLEDYANMNNTGFAFIDLNEEFKNYNYIFDIYYENEKEMIDIDTADKYGSDEYNIYEKIKEIYESKKPLIVKVKFNVINSSDETHKFYDTIIRNVSIYKGENGYEIVMNMGFQYSKNTNSFSNNDYAIILIRTNYSEGNGYSFRMLSIYKGV